MGDGKRCFRLLQPRRVAEAAKEKKKPGEIKVYVLGQPRIKHEDAAAAAAPPLGLRKRLEGNRSAG